MAEYQDGLENIVHIAEELICIMDNEKNEKQILDKCFREWQKILEIREFQKIQTKNIIQDIIEMESVAEGDYRKTEAASEQIHHEGRSVEQIASQKKQELSAVQSECTKLQEKLDSCQQEAQRLQIEKQEMEKQNKISIPKARHDITLYKLITNLQWQLDTPPNEIRGYVYGNTEVKPFSFNTAQTSRYDICNSLWQRIEEDSEVW